MIRTLISLCVVFLCAGSTTAAPNSPENLGCAHEVSLIRLPGYEVIRGQLVTEDYVVLVARMEPPEQVDAPRNTYVFAKNSGTWRGYVVAQNSAVVATYFSERQKRIFVWTMHDVEGPGSSFSGVALDSDGKPAFCTTVVFPTELNKPTWAMEHLDFLDFNIDEEGLGILVAQATVERNGKEYVWIYQYLSNSDGRNWGEAVRIEDQPPTSGTFQKFSDGDVDRYSAELEELKKE